MMIMTVVHVLRVIPQRGQDTMSLGGNAAFSAPRMRPLSSRQNGYVAASTVQLRATANTLQSRDIRRDAAGSIQSLVAPCTLRKRVSSCEQWL